MTLGVIVRMGWYMIKQRFAAVALSGFVVFPALAGDNALVAELKGGLDIEATAMEMARDIALNRACGLKIVPEDDYKYIGAVIIRADTDKFADGTLSGIAAAKRVGPEPGSGVCDEIKTYIRKRAEKYAVLASELRERGFAKGF